MTEKYKTHKIAESKSKKASKLGLTVNTYIDHLESLVEQGRTNEQVELKSTVQSLVGTVASLTDALKHQRFITDTQGNAQSKKIDDLTALVSQLIEIQTKQTIAYGADIEFIQALKKEITA